MPAVSPTPRVKLRTATRRVPRARNAEADASTIADPEPNMRLSRAILVMLLLHVVAVGGILAFSLIKERGHGHAAANPAGSAVEAEDSDVPAKIESHDTDHVSPDPAGTLANARTAHPADRLTRVSNEPAVAASATPNAANDAAARIAGGRGNAAVSPSPAAAGDKNSHLPANSGKTYVVQKGDSPYSIAEKLKVDAAALLKLNGIDDPKKLKPGQTLHVPAAVHAKTK